MMATFARRLLVLLFALPLLGTAAPACDDDIGTFSSCPLTPRIVDACREDAPATRLTCAVRQHPVCGNTVCATWQDSPSFCTIECVDSAGCPSGSTCQPYLDFGFCVQDEVVANPTGTTQQ